MGLAIDLVAGFIANPSSTFTAVTMSSGDSNRVRDFNPGTKAWLTQVIRKGATSGSVRVFSALLHDAVRGITVLSAENPSKYELLREAGQPVQPGDVLTIQLTGGSAETDLVGLEFYYQDLAGADAKLYSWPDISGHIEHIKPVLVTATTSGTIGTWLDTAINATEDLFKADRKYAVLGYVVDVAVGLVAVKGSETGNLRVGGPGMTNTDDTSHFFVDQSIRHGMPRIPVFRANNKAAFFVSMVTDTASVAVNAQMILGLLDPSFG